MPTVLQRSFVAVVGASGSGKSSVVRAGLIPHLRDVNGGPVWDMVSLEPGDRPLVNLAKALIPLLKPELCEIKRLARVVKLASHLRTGNFSLRDIVERVLEKQPGTDRLLLFVDQWEELYTLTADAEARRLFVAQLLKASAAAPMTVVLTLRGDFYGQVLADRALSDRLQGDAVVNLGPMTRDELREAIEKPAAKVSLSFEEGLVGRILDDAGEEPGNLPLMEFVLEALWERRRSGHLHHQAYEEIGGLRGAIAARAEAEYAALSDPEKAAARWLLLQLVRPGEGTEDTRRRAELADADVASLTLVQKLVHARLLVTAQDAQPDHKIVEVAHEALIRKWPRLRMWVNKDREFLRTRERVQAAADYGRRRDGGKTGCCRG